jgi:4'-phosphopantetheinyl transferase
MTGTSSGPLELLLVLSSNDRDLGQRENGKNRAGLRRPASRYSLIAVADQEVHIWWLSLQSEPQDVEQALSLLSAEEQGRARRYHFARDRNRFVLARAFLRRLLGDYTGEEAVRVPLRLSLSGKPFLVDRSDFHFNLSHCEDRGVVAIARQPVGVDLEKIRIIPEALTIAEHLFAISETRALRAYPAELQSEAFLRCWTRKEAYVKGRGEGLLTPLVSFEVTLDHASPELVLLREPGEEKWKLHNLETESGWTGALAVELESARLVPRVWPPS